MNKIKISIVLFMVAAVLVTVFAASGRSTAGETSTTALDAKLDKIVSNQEQILQKLDDMAAQIQIVKIRATR
ncbi:hypothetical protein D4R42_05165 [bacterium]|nr:MAG: hypothetical protein D4R42_05165 [bacterium]